MRWRRPPGVLWRAAPGYLVLGSVEGDVLEIDGPGADVWANLGGWITLDALADRLAGEYHAEPDAVAGDVQRLLDQLHERAFVEQGA